MRILFVSANPCWTEKRDLAEELRTLQNCLQGHDVELRLLPAVRPEDLREVLQDGDRPVDIVHFAGRASQKEGLFFRDAEGGRVPLPPAQLRELLEESGVKLVVLNVSDTSPAADALSGTEANGAAVAATISTQQALRDGVPNLMTKVLYSTLAKGASITTAFAAAREAIVAPNKSASDRGRFVYALRPSAAEAALFPSKALEGAEARSEAAPGVPGIDEADRQRFDRYFYLDYLDDQIATLTRNVRTNHWILGGLVALVVALLALRQFRPDDVWSFVSSLFLWVRDVVVQLGRLLIGETLSSDETPMLDALQALAPAVPGYYAALQTRWAVHGKVKLRQLRALRDLVKTSDELSLTLRARLDKIMDESLRAADRDWNPLTNFVREWVVTAAKQVSASRKERQEA